MNYGALFRSALVALLRNKMRSILTVLGITIGIAAVICVVAIGKVGQARVQQQLNNLGDNFVWIEAGGRAVNGVRTMSESDSCRRRSDLPLGYRLWTAREVQYLKWVASAKRAGFTLHELAEVFRMYRAGARACSKIGCS